MSAWTTRALLTLIVVVASLGFGREVIRWWHAGPEDPTLLRPFSLGAAPGDQGPSCLLQFGSLPWLLRRQTLVGGKEQALGALRRLGLSALRTGDWPSEPAGDAEKRLLAGLTSAKPVDQQPGQWSLYQLKSVFPRVVGVRGSPRAEAATKGGAVALDACRVVTWGMAIPMPEGAWTMYVFSPGVPSRAQGNTVEPPIPPDGTKLLSMHVLGGGLVMSFQGRAGLENWIGFYDRWFPQSPWQPIGGWQRRGGTCGLRCREKESSSGGVLDLEFVAEPQGPATGLLMITPSEGHVGERQHP
jgi:hypothetical protein